MSPTIIGTTWSFREDRPDKFFTLLFFIAFIVSDFDAEVADPAIFHPDKPVQVRMLKACN